MPRPGPRPHVWVIKDELQRKKYYCYLQQRAQAQFRNERFELTFDDFQNLWADHWHQRGRHSQDYCLTRIDPEGAWNNDNVHCIPRVEHIRIHIQRQAATMRENKYGKTTLSTKVR